MMYGMNNDEGADMAQLLYGRDARHVPAWAYIQRQSNNVVGIIGSSKVDEGHIHPLLYRSGYQHVFILGELVVRPHFAIGTDALMGTSAAGLYAGDHDIEEMLSNGRLVAGSEEALRRVREQWR